MSSEEKKIKKKKREKLVQAKLLKQRREIQKERKLAAMKDSLEKEAREIVHGKPVPFFKNPEALLKYEAKQKAKREAKREELIAKHETLKTQMVTDKLKHNLELLEALEREYDKEQAVRTEVNEKLEAEGHLTMRQKMDALHQKALELTGNADALKKATQEHAEKQKEIIIESEKNN